MYMKHTCLFWLIIPIFITVLISSTTTSGYSSTLDNNTVLQQAQRSLEANQKQFASVTTEPVPSVVPTAVQEIQGTSMVDGVFFTWVIISSDNELSVNLRYVGDGTTPPVSLAATALSGKGKPVTMKGSTSLNAAWSSPSSVTIELNGGSSLYDSTSIDVVASPLGSSPPLSAESTSPILKPKTNLLMAAPPSADIWTRIQLTLDESFENYYHIPLDSAFNFKSGSRLCPVSPCEQEFFDGVLRQAASAPNLYFFEGTLKIIDKSVASNPDIKNWLYYPFDGEFLIKSTKENTKAGSTVETFVGDLGFDRDELRTGGTGIDVTHDIQYSIQGTFELPSKILTLVGKIK
jgi:hypothetical protein